MKDRKPNPNTSLPFVLSPEIQDGSKLAGDDLNEEQLARWYKQEEEAYYEQAASSNSNDPWYDYMRFVYERLGFSFLERMLDRIENMLIVGPGPGTEIEAFAHRNPQCELTFLESSKNFQAELRGKFPGASFIAPTPFGDIQVSDSSQDVVCALAVLHHIANVSKVVRECARVTRPGGVLFVREPCSAMGDWRYPRSTTPNERGISRKLMLDIARRAGFAQVRKEIPIFFEPINKILKRTIGYSNVPFGALYFADRLLSTAVAVNDYYWRNTPLKKVGPSSYLYLFKKAQFA